MEKCNAYHGTDIKSKNKILEESHFIESSKDNEWAGTGVYFFVNSNDNRAQHNAYMWALYKTKGSNIGIISAEIEYDLKELLDLEDDDIAYYFHKYREAIYQKASAIAKEKGRELIQKYYKKSYLDCATINQMCQSFNYKIVKRRVYINILEDNKDKRFPKSYIPNCTIICVRDQNNIKKIGGLDEKAICRFDGKTD